MRFVRLGLGVVVVAAIIAAGFYFFDPDRQWQGSLRGEPFYAGRAASAWHHDLGEADENTRAQSEQALKDGQAEAVPVLRWILRAPGGPEPRWRAADALGQMGPVALDAGFDLIATLQDPDPRVQQVAAKALAELGPEVPGAVPALMELFPDAQVIRIVARYKTAGAPAVPKLITLLTHEDVTVRWNAARTLGKIGEPSVPAIPALVAQLTDPDGIIREHAAEALGDIGPAAASTIPNLIPLLKDPEWKVRRDTVRSLGYMGPAAKSVLAQVQAMKADPHPEVQSTAVRAEALIEPKLDKRNEGRTK